MSSLNSSVKDGEYRSFVAEGFLDLFSEGKEGEPFVANYLIDLERAFHDMPVLFDGSDENEDREFHTLSIFVAIGYCVGWMDSELERICDLSVSAGRVSQFSIPIEVCRLAREWISEGPVVVTAPVKEALKPYESQFVADQGFYRGYMGGIESQSLGIGVH